MSFSYPSRRHSASFSVPYRLLVGALVAGGCVAGAAPALAHGRFPRAGQIVVDPTDSSRVLVRTTYGVVSTADGGERWSWTCPEAVGFDADTEDPALGISATGALVAGTFSGLSVARDGLCDWALEPGELADKYFIDVQMRADPTGAVALRSNGVAADTFEVDLYESTDAADSWSRVGERPPADFLGLTLGLAPADADRIYLTGRDGTGEVKAGVMMRSDDHGDSWQRLVVPGTDDGALPYMGGVDPSDAGVVYVGVIRQELSQVVHFELLVTTDGGQSWDSIFEHDGEVSGFAISPDGQRLAIGGASIGLWVADRDTRVFAQAAAKGCSVDGCAGLRIGCLTWDTSGLYACTDEFVDGFSMGVSHDDGASFSPLMNLGSPCGPPTCADGSPVTEMCVPRWPEERAELGAKDCDQPATTASASTSGGASGDSSGACGCEVAGPRGTADDGRSTGGLGGALLAALGLGILHRASRRKR